MEPFWGEDGSDEAGGAGNRGGEATGAKGGTVDEEEELVRAFAAINMVVEGDGEDAFVDTSRGDFYLLHRTTTDDDTREVDLAVGGEAVFVELAEDGIGAVVLPDGVPMKSNEVGLFHVGRELGDHRKVAAVDLLCLGLRIGHRGGHGALALPPMPGVVYFVAEFTALGIALFSCHNYCVLGQ